MHLTREERDMKNFADSVVNFLKEEDGPTAVEYAVMLALIVVVCLAGVTSIGTSANAKFVEVATAISG
jgi:pilus assembly protein Flp/PilA